MQSHIGLNKFLSIALALAVAFIIIAVCCLDLTAGQKNDDVGKGATSDTESKSSSKDGDGVSTSSGAMFEPQGFIVNDVYKFVRVRRIRENMSMGVCREGLHFSIDW